MGQESCPKTQQQTGIERQPSSHWTTCSTWTQNRKFHLFDWSSCAHWLCAGCQLASSQMRAETSWKYLKGKTFLDFVSNEFVNNVSEGRAAVSDWFVHNPAAKSGERVRDGLKQMLLRRCFSYRVIPATKVTCLMPLQSWQYNTDTLSGLIFCIKKCLQQWRESNSWLTSTFRMDGRNGQLSPTES